MKIGLVQPYNITKGGGVQSHVLAQAAELIKRGHDVAIITPQPREPYADEGRKVIFLGTATDLKAMNTVSQVSASVLTDEIDSVLEREQFDILHFHEPWVPVLSRQILSRSHAVNVATFHAKLPETIISRTMSKIVTPYTKPLLRHIDAFTAVSGAAAEYLLSLADVDVTIIPNGINLKHFGRADGISRDAKAPKTILYVGRLENRKGVRYLLQAWGPGVHRGWASCR
jgi:phosphatidylinositol alpha-mannosyltransferase